jgi:pyruvate/2-oxoglutarate dehydrogenase complex dihydrolipoamide dehydrogenase (E3) component
LEGQTEGFARLHVERRSGRILGATLVGAHAGESISEVALAMTAGLKASHLSATVHPYPTRSEVLRKLGDAYNRTRLTPRVRGLFSQLLALRRWKS